MSEYGSPTPSRPSGDVASVGPYTSGTPSSAQATPPGTIRRRYDQTTTPFDRLLTLNALDDVTRQAWEDKRLAINPLQMRETIYALRDQLLAMPTTTGPGDVRVLLDLLYPSHTTIPLEEAALPR